ncbi:Hypp502 [Branchiostoma lanceolatum]|uniref:Hypp502 protein n=1 Tax=Branchiostoma lanceolatum TaxID=7740 RepID=A0A8J9YPZ4_BRALA|nr:Hypp502 [Branchiostoma lanceolatum]
MTQDRGIGQPVVFQTTIIWSYLTTIFWIHSRMPVLKAPPTLKTSCLDVVCRLPGDEWGRPHIAVWLPKITSDTRQPHNLCANLYQSLLDHLIQTEQLQSWHLNYVAHDRLTCLRFEKCLDIIDVDSAKLISMRCPNLEDVSLLGRKQLPVRSIQLMLGSFAHLRVLDINYTKADDTTMMTLARGCPELQELRIMKTNVTDVGLFELCGLGESGEGCKKVTKLWMYDLTKVTLFGVSYVIRALKELKELYTEHNIGFVVYGIYQECLLHNLPLSPLKLDYVSFSSATAKDSPGEKTFTPAPASYIKALKLCPNLTNLVINVEMVADIDEEVLLSLFQLKILALADSNPELSNGTFQRDVIPFLSKVGAMLEKVTLIDFSEVDVLAVASHCPVVLSLAFQNVQGVAEEPVRQVKDSVFQSIEYFQLDIYVDDVPEESVHYQLERVLKNAPKLKRLHLEYVHCFTDDFMTDVMKYNKFESLQTLKLIECHCITRKTIEALMNTANNFSELMAVNCEKLKTTDLEYLRKLAAWRNISFSVVEGYGKNYHDSESDVDENDNGEEQWEEM